MGLITTDAEIRMALAELLRQDDLTLEPEERRSVRRVTGWRDATTVRYPGMSCEYEVAAIDIWYETWDGEDKLTAWQGEFGHLMTRLAQIVEDY